MKPDPEEQTEILSASLDESMFVVMALVREIGMSISGAIHKMPLNYADGMVGAIPVFKTREEAEKFSDGNFSVVEVKPGEYKPVKGNNNEQ